MLKFLSKFIIKAHFIKHIVSSLILSNLILTNQAMYYFHLINQITYNSIQIEMTLKLKFVYLF